MKPEVLMAVVMSVPMCALFMGWGCHVAGCYSALEQYPACEAVQGYQLRIGRDPSSRELGIWTLC